MADKHDIVEKVYKAKGNSILADELIQDYIPFIKSETAKFTKHSVELGVDDELSIGMIAFHQAIESYDKAKGAFLGFCSVIIKNRLIDYTRKEKRHAGIISLDRPAYSDSEKTMLEELADDKDEYEALEIKDATREEILELTHELESFGLSLTDIADNCPRQERTLNACRQAVDFCTESFETVASIKATGKLPISLIAEKLKISKKTLERHRKYILALVIIYSNGYTIIRGHLKQVFPKKKGGDRK